MNLNGELEVRVVGNKLTEKNSYGALVRCDVPAPRNPNAATNP